MPHLPNDLRDGFFEKGSPVNPELWPIFKDIAARYKGYLSFDMKNTEVSIDLIRKAFSRILNSVSGQVLRSSEQQFESWCELNNLQFINSTPQKYSYTINSKLNKV